MTSTIKRATILCGLVAFLVNPGFGCGPLGDFEYGEAELRAAVEGSWEAKIPDEGGERTVAFTLAPAPPPAGAGAASASGPAVIRPAAACDSRDFYRSAAACIETATLHLAGRVGAADGALADTAVSGFFMSSGKTYDGGSLTVKFVDGSQIVARIDGKNALIDASQTPPRGASRPIALARAAR